MSFISTRYYNSAFRGWAENGLLVTYWWAWKSTHHHMIALLTPPDLSSVSNHVATSNYTKMHKYVLTLLISWKFQWRFWLLWLKCELQLYCNLFLSCYEVVDCCYDFENANMCTKKWRIVFYLVSFQSSWWVHHSEDLNSCWIDAWIFF